MDEIRSRFPSAKAVVCGDIIQFNTNEIAEQLNLTQVVDFPTHCTNTLDLILSDVTQHYLPPEPLPPIGLSNNNSILWSPALSTSRPTRAVAKTYRPVTDSAMRQFGQWVTQHLWTEVLDIDDVHTFKK
ncbi:hypothetical protein E2C01_092256 [Portunus trituberculatus]|uniref:Uncharacterized protein n=1 Tax=Portunus trituberculatus TaxID=210409 RepID=A0A5B7JG17_PORTR|nr:hypothetical protein [Portunus trituberculatus]